MARKSFVKKGVLKWIKDNPSSPKWGLLAWGPIAESKAFKSALDLDELRRSGFLTAPGVQKTAGGFLLDAAVKALATGDASWLKDFAESIEAIVSRHRNPQNPYTILMRSFSPVGFTKQSINGVISYKPLHRPAPTIEEATARLAEKQIYWEPSQVAEALKILGIPIQKKKAGRHPGK